MLGWFVFAQMYAVQKKNLAKITPGCACISRGLCFYYLQLNYLVREAGVRWLNQLNKVIASS